jgi:hypothetical protein
MWGWVGDVLNSNEITSMNLLKSYDKKCGSSCDRGAQKYAINFVWWTSKVIGNVNFTRAIWRLVVEMLL